MTPLPQRSGDGRRNEESERPDETSGDARRADDGGRSDRGSGISEWFASSAIRIGLTLVGVVLLVFAIGQAVGLPLLEMAADALSTQTGQWLMVAFLAILLIAGAQRIGAST